MRPMTDRQRIAERIEAQRKGRVAWCSWEAWQCAPSEIWPYCALAAYLRTTPFEGALGHGPTTCELRAALAAALPGTTVVPRAEPHERTR